MSTVSPTQQQILDLNAQYLDNADLLSSLETKLKHGLEDLVLPPPDLAFATEFVEDHVTLFRFLKDSEFDETLAYGRIMDTILWRKEMNMDQISWDTIHSSFYNHDQPAFAFFHKQDRFERPVAVIRMRHFPNFGGLALSETIPPFACLVMEIARKWTCELTRLNEQGGERGLPVLVSQIVVVIDISKSPMVPLEKRLIQELRAVTDDRFPGFFGSIYIMNFGWMYQGLWQMVKLLLSDRAKSKINFPSAQEVKEYIDEDSLLQELGGTDTYEWTLENDTILQKYGSGWKMKSPPPTPISLESTTRPSRSPSIASTYSSDDFYDALESPALTDYEYQEHHHQHIQPLMPMTPGGYTSVYGTPGSLTPIGIRSPSHWPPSSSLTATSSTTRSLFPAPPSSTKQYFHLTGIHIPSFLASIFGSGPSYTVTETTPPHEGVCGVDLSYRLTNIALERRQFEANRTMDLMVEQQTLQRREPHFPHLLPADSTAPLTMKLRRSEQRLMRITRRLFRLSFAYNGTLYWVLLYIFLRGPVEQSVHQILAKMIKNPRTTTFTTIGVAASLAGGLGASLASSLG
ncbi:hypothetical protein [Absidia glauca]|uniref:CRAL-TRIO domain-containing protein n=1 Tax=Absidia glauca TaxID=4829 RepID=A0A168SYU0_ABSGL|nr:hypothetical protein [Absidia glauca]